MSEDKLQDRLRAAFTSGEVIDGNQVPEFKKLPADLIADVIKKNAGTLDTVHIKNSEIDGELNIAAITLKKPLRIRDCILNGLLVLDDAKTSMVDLTRSQLSGIRADRLTTDSEIKLKSVTSSARIALRNARIGGDLNLKRAKLNVQGDSQYSLDADNAEIRGVLSLAGEFVSNRSVSLLNVRVGGDLDCRGGTFGIPTGEEFSEREHRAIYASSAQIGGSVYLTEGFSAKGPVRFAGADIGRDLRCTDGHINVEADTPEEEGSLYVERAKVGGNIHLDGKFSANSTVSFVSTRVGGEIIVSDAEIEAGNLAINLSISSVEGSVSISDSAIRGRIKGHGARIRGNFGISSASVSSKRGDKPTISLAGSDINGNIWLSNAEVSGGSIRLQWCKIRGDLNIEASTLSHAVGEALSADNVDIGGSITFASSTSRGSIRLSGAKVAGTITLSESSLSEPIAEKPKGDQQLAEPIEEAIDISRKKKGVTENPWEDEAVAIFADGLQLGGDIVILGKTRISGEARFVGAVIKGDFTIVDAFLEKQGDVLSCHRCSIGGNVYLEGIDIDNQFNAIGTISFTAADIKGGFIVQNVRAILGAGNSSDVSINLRHARVNGGIALKKNLSIDGVVDLQFATAGMYEELEADVYYLPKVALDGFSYSAMRHRNPENIKEWFKRQPKFESVYIPQPYEQAIRVLRQQGLEKIAKSLAIEKNNQLLEKGKLPPARRATLWLSKHIIQHGYSAARAGWGILGVIALGCVIFYLGLLSGHMVPSSQSQSANTLAQQQMISATAAKQGSKSAVPTPTSSILPRIDGTTALNAVLYSVDAFLPIVSLDQKKRWDIVYEGSVPAAVLWGYRIAHSVLGWILTTLFVAGVSGIIRRE